METLERGLGRGWGWMGGVCGVGEKEGVQCHMNARVIHLLFPLNAPQILLVAEVRPGMDAWQVQTAQ